MSSITPVQDHQGINNMNPAQDLQKSTSLHGRAFHKITEGGKHIVQTINNIAQSILSTCIRVVSFGRYNLDSLKSYFFSNQTALKDDEIVHSSNLPMQLEPSAPPPPPPIPSPDDLSRVSRSSIAVRSNSYLMQNPSQKDDPILADGTNSRSPSLHGGSNPGVEEKSSNSPNVSLQEEKNDAQKEITDKSLLEEMKNNNLFRRFMGKITN